MLMTQAGQNKKKLDPYLIQKIKTASPDQLISYVYDSAIAACSKKDSYKASTAVRELIKSLNFEYKQISVVFYNVYRYINNKIIKGHFEEAREMLIDIKKTWASSMKVS